MPACMVILTRTPMEGELFSVLKEQIESITAIAQSDNRPMSSGNVTITVGNTETESLDVTTALRFESYREYDDFQKNIIANDSYTVRFDSIASKCKSVSVNLCEIIKSVEGITEGFSGTYLVRNVFIAKPGKRSELVDALIEQRESLTTNSPKPNILKSLSSWDEIRSTRPFDSYEALAESLSQIESPANRSGFDQIVNLTNRMTRTISKIECRL